VSEDGEERAGLPCGGDAAAPSEPFVGGSDAG
jgi:hypothetical protein